MNKIGAFYYQLRYTLIIRQPQMMQLNAAIDIPPEYGTLEKYRATLGHKGSYLININKINT